MAEDFAGKLHDIADRAREKIAGAVNDNDGAAEDSAAKNEREPSAFALRRANIGELVSTISMQVHDLIYGEIDLAKARAKGMVKKVGTGGVLLAVAALLALYMLGVLLHAAVLGLAHAVPDWAAALIVAGMLLVVILILALIGVALLKRGTREKPDPVGGLKRSVDAAKSGARAGKEAIATRPASATDSSAT